MHKTTKESYAGTNHQTSIVAKQLLTVRTVAEEDANEADHVSIDHDDHSSFSSIFISTILLGAELLPNCVPNQLQYTEPTLCAVDEEIARRMKHTLQAELWNAPVHQAQTCALSQLDKFTRKKIWKTIKFVKFNARFD
eukprot:IDg22238t1